MARENNWPHGSPQARSIDERALGAARDKIVRNNSVANDIRLGLPVSIPIGLEEEERTRRRTSPILQFPAGYDSRSEIQRPYIKPPPNKTVCCIPNDPGDGTNRGSPSCSCGPTTSHKNSFTGNNSGWGLNWGRSGNSPPSHRHQHPPHHHRHPSTCHPSSSSSVLKPQKNVSSAGVIGTFLAGVITSASDKGGGGAGFQDNFKSITGVSSSSSDPKLRFLSERKPVNDRTSPTPNVNTSSSSTSLCSRTLKHGDSVLIGHHSNQQTFKYDDGCSQPPPKSQQQQHQFTSSRDSGSSSPNNPFFESFASPTDTNNAILGNSDRRQKYDRKKDRNGNRATAETQQPSTIDADHQKHEDQKTLPHTSNYNCWGELLDCDNAAAPKSSSSIIMTDPHLVCRSMGVQPSALSESIQEEIGELSTEPSSSNHQLANKYCTKAKVMSSEEEINDPTTEEGQEDARNRRKGERGGVT